MFDSDIACWCRQVAPADAQEALIEMDRARLEIERR
jgi:hypothetical protein